MIESICALVDTEPTTIAGVLALLGYVWEFNVDGLAITKNWYSNSELRPQTMTQDDVLDVRGEPIEMEFSNWILRNVEQALRNIAAVA